ncbi:hypothetical protein GQ44DRAFT_731584 [Phaeosphaeriaceae sp. PMI808]|nr:hypothetical protein GQ44DRAFT_731584 [Phaeosphaeriaceae sp. PMI808]
MAFSPLPLFWSADEVERLFNSPLGPEYYSLHCQTPWSVGTIKQEIYADADEQEYSPFNLDLVTFMAMRLVSEEIDASHFFEAAESSLVSTKSLVNDETGGQDPEHGDPRITSYQALPSTVVKEQNAVGHDADQECDTETNHEPATVLLGGDTEAPLHQQPLRSPSHPPAFGKSELERVPVDLAHVMVEDVTGVEATQNEGDADEHAYQDHGTLSAVSEHGSDQGYQAVGHNSSNQNEMHDDLFMYNDEVSIERLGVSVTDKQEQEVKAPTGAGTGPDHEATPNDICPSHRGNFEAHITEAQEEPELSNGEADDGPGSLHVEAEGNKNGTAQASSKDMAQKVRTYAHCETFANITDNPILLDDEEPLRPLSLQSTPTAARIDNSSANNGNESSQVTAHFLTRSTRKKRKRSLDGMQPWGSAEFQESETENLQSAWLSVQIRWCAIETLLLDLKVHRHSFELSVTNFHTYWFDFCAKVKHSGSIDSLSVAGLIDHWTKVEQELRKVQDNDKKKSEVLGFGQTLNWLEDKTALCACIDEFSSSIDRRDEEKDEDFKEKESSRASKTRRRRL